MEEIEFGVQFADGGDDAEQPLDVRLYALEGVFEVGNLTEIADNDVSVEDDDSGELVSVVRTPLGRRHRRGGRGTAAAAKARRAR